MYTKEQIQNNLRTNRRWIERAIILLYTEGQTTSEQIIGATKVVNYVGFNGPDSRYLSYIAKWLLSNRTLNEKHLQKCATKLPKYWKQIQNFIEYKSSQQK